MHNLRFDPGKPSSAPFISWQKDRQFRMNPETVTTLLREQVPVLGFVGWQMAKIEPGMAQSIVPLNAESTNQHFTHQAALFLLAADYTGGTALGSLFTGWPAVGVHPVLSSKSMSVWLLKSELKYLRPSVEDLVVSAKIDEDRTARLRERFAAGRTIIETVTIEFHNGDVLVAEATATYFARQSAKLRSEGIKSEKINPLYELKLTSSAEMIAGVRARENGRLFFDPFATEMAGQHGMALATRFCERSPQLGGMVAARTWHLDQQIENFVAAGGRDIVLVGVGWDMRPFRLILPEGTRVYELDFPSTLTERRRRLEQLGVQDPPGITRIEIPVDLRTMTVASVLLEQLPPDASVFLAWEGMSMYFEEDEVRDILEGMIPVLSGQNSLLWCDLVNRDAVDKPHVFGKSAEQFMRGMQILGEPFTFGVNRVKDFMRDNNLRCLEVVTSDICLNDNDNEDPVYGAYQFCVASSRLRSLKTTPTTFQSTRVDAPSEPGPTASTKKPAKKTRVRQRKKKGAKNVDPPTQPR